VSLKTITTFGQFTLEGMPMDLQLECHEETIGFFMVSLIVNSLT
jgi:hypothetical protein